MLFINNIISRVTIEDKVTHEQMTMFRLIFKGGGGPAYLTLAEALEGGLARVSEVSTSGSVPELRFENSAELPVLIIDGEELVGAKQNRVANLTILAPAKKTTTIPVSCVEAGRWHSTREDFVASDRVHFSKGRSARFCSVSRSMQSHRGPLSDQGRVWHDIEAKAARMKAPSPTQAMAAIFERHQRGVEGYVAEFTARERQGGAIFAIGGAVVGLDLFDEPATFGSMLPKLVRSYALDAIEVTRRNGRTCDSKTADAFLARLGSAEKRAYPAVGMGTDIRLTGRGIVAGALVVGENLVHLAAFATDESATDDSGRRGPRMARAVSRRRSYEEN
jgi:hypothetical protein